MKLKFLLFFLLPTQFLLSQDRETLLTLEYHYGLNANAYTFDDVAKPFLDEGLGRNFGMDINYIFLKNNNLLQFSTSWSVINQVLSPSNLIHEFGFSYDNDCCLRATSFLMFTGGVKYVYPFYQKEKLEILGAVGLNLNLDIYTAATGVAVGTRDYWSSFDNKNGPAIFPSVDLSTRLNYHLTDKLIVTSSLSLVHAPFYSLDFTYTINSRDGLFEGLYYQKLSSSSFSLGLGLKL